MRVVLFGSTDLTRAVADRVLSLGIPLAGVVHVGRQFSISYRPDGVTNARFADMASWSGEHAVPLHEHRAVDDTVAFCRDLAPDFGLAAGWYHLLPARLRAVFPKGCAGLHASLLPKFRGGAPLNWALLAGEHETGVSLFELDDGVDTGPLYGQRSFPIPARARIGDLVASAQEAALELMSEVLPAVEKGTARPVPQQGAPSYSLMRFPEDGRIDWRRPASEIDLLVRAVSRPYPGASTTFESTQVLVWGADVLSPDIRVFGAPGQIARLPEDPDPCVVTGAGVLVLREVTDGDGTCFLDRLRKAGHRRFDVFGGGPGAS